MAASKIKKTPSAPKQKTTTQVMPGKVVRPVPGVVYGHARLCAWLDQARSSPLIWIAGAPGAGKTTLVADYLKRRKLQALWYQIDSGDDDIATFFHYMDVAAGGVEPNRSKRASLPRLTPDYMPGLANFTRRYFQALYARIKPPFIVVLDNYQDAAETARLHEVVRDSLDQLPKGANVIVISRNDPPAAFARLRVNNLLTVLASNELRLTYEEARGLIASRCQKELSEDVLRHLHERTQGWLAGLILMAEQLNAGQVEEPPLLEASQLLFDYFAGEVFQKMDERTQDVLLHSVFLPRMTPDMVTRLSGEGAARILNELSRRNYFTENYARPEPVYQYHPLLREFLLTRAQASFSSERLHDIQRRAAELLEHAGQYEDAIELYARIGDVPRMTRVILNHAAETVAQGRHQTLEAWVSQLPKDIIERSPWLLYWLGVCRVQFNTDEGREYFERAFARFKARNDLDGIFMAWSGVIEAICHGYTELALLDFWISTLESLLHEHSSLPSPEIEARVSCNMLLALVFRQLHHPEIENWIKRANRLTQQVQDEMLSLVAIGSTTLYSLWTGDIPKASAALDRLRKTLTPDNCSPLVQAAAHVITIIHQLYRTTHTADLRAMNDGLAIAAATRVHIWDAVLLAEGAGIALSAGDETLAAELLERMHNTLDESRRMDVCLYHFFSAWAAFLKNDVAGTIFHGESALALAVEAGSVNVEERCHLIVGQALHRRGERDAAWNHLTRARRSMERRSDRLTEFICDLTEAEFYVNEGKRRPALATLKRAMRLGAEKGYVNFYAWQPKMMTQLCALALESKIETAYVQKLVWERRLLPNDSAFEREHWPWPIRIYTLGRFAIVKENKPFTFRGKAQEKPLELLRALIAFGGRDVPEGRLIEALWPDTEGDAAHQALHTTLHRLRKLIGIDKIIVVQAHKLTLDHQYCWVDTWVLERLLGKIDAALNDPAQGSKEEVVRLADRVMDLYRGAFLGRDTDRAWAISLQERLHGKFQRVLAALGVFWEQTSQWERLVTNYQKAIDADDLTEEFYQRLMRGYLQLGRRADALSVYQRCQRVLNAALGKGPSAETMAIRASLDRPT